MYVYEQTEFSGKAGATNNLWTVGHYQPGTNEWHPDSDHSDREKAAARVAHLNGGGKKLNTDELLNTAGEIADEIDEADGKAAAEQYTDTDELWQQLRRWAKRLRDAVHNQA